MVSSNWKSAIAMAILAMTTMILSACQPTPESPFVSNKENGGLITSKDTVKGSETPDFVKESVQKGDLSLEIDAQVFLPKNDAYYIYPVGFFDLGNDEFRQRALAVFFGSDSLKKVDIKEVKSEGYYRYTQQLEGGESSLTLETQKQVASFISNKLQANVDLSEANTYTADETIDIGITEAQAKELAQDVVDGLDLEKFECRIIKAFGKLDNHNNDFYEIVYCRNIGEAQIVNASTCYSNQENYPSNDTVMVIVGKGGVWMVNMCVADLQEKAEQVSVVSFQTAFSAFKQGGFAKLSEAMARGTKYTVTEIQLAYIYAHANDADTLLIPVWVFVCKGIEVLESGETVTSYINVPLSASDGTVLN